MNGRRGLALVLAAGITLPAAAQDAPPPSPRAAGTGTPAASAFSGNETSGEAAAPLPAEPRENAPPARPETAPWAADDLGRPAPRPDDEGGVGEEAGTTLPAGRTPEASPGEAPVSSGALIPPEAYAESVVPLAAIGPPAFVALRETDFDHAACRLGLTMLGVTYSETAPLMDPEDRDCGIARPVTVTQIQPGVTLEGGAPLRCETARALALWMREVVIPAAGRTTGSPRLTSVSLGTTYACRDVVGGASEARISEHALGNAIDIAAFGFDNGSRIEIAPPADRGDLGVAFQHAVQGAACLYFATVLGPGSNAAHDNHLHLDIKARQGGFRLCQ